MITAKIVLDSISPAKKRITTMELCYPRFIHAEFMTHRVFSRNASSSRAIPVKTMIERIRKDPAMPVYWGENKPGMQAGAEIADKATAKALWLGACENACNNAEAMSNMGIHKQVVNRLTEPFAHITVLVTATEWKNFFELRDHEAAQPEIRVLAIEMKKAMDESTADYVDFNQWHLPYITKKELGFYSTAILCKLSTARCARVSYMNHDGTNPDIHKDIDLYDKLIMSKPTHASPTEHQATPVFDIDERSGNFFGWEQYRKNIGL